METQTDILSDVLGREPATMNQRLTDFIIDIIIYYILSFVAGYILATAIAGAGTAAAYLIGITVVVGYYTIMEGLTNGKTVGKMVSKTRAVREDGLPFTIKDAFLRSLCRLVPFEPLSIFFAKKRPWHDEWTKTTVVKD